jgi:hypothetical protein
VARRYGLAVVPLNGRVLAPRCPALVQEPHSCRRAPRRHGLNAVGCGGRSLPSWATTPDVHLSKILIRPFIFRKSRQNKYKKFFAGWQYTSKSHNLAWQPSYVLAESRPTLAWTAEAKSCHAPSWMRPKPGTPHRIEPTSQAIASHRCRH